MILANARQQFSRADAQLAVRLVAQESSDELERVERRLADDGLDSILDDARLPEGLMRSKHGAYASLRLFLYVMVRHALLKVGERDRVLSDYCAAMLLAFSVKGRAERLSGSDDQMYDTLASLVNDLDDADPRRAFLVRAHLGNQALWIAGVYPDHVEYRRWHRGGPMMDYFESLGRRGFELAAAHRVADRYGMTGTYTGLADRFGVLRVALNQLSDTLFFPNHHTPERLMRQVSDEARWRRTG
jgi:hypothetical protein